jgi:hypothetical protein
LVNVQNNPWMDHQHRCHDNLLATPSLVQRLADILAEIPLSLSKEDVGETMASNSR